MHISLDLIVISYFAEVVGKVRLSNLGYLHYCPVCVFDHFPIKVSCKRKQKEALSSSLSYNPEWSDAIKATLETVFCNLIQS